MSKLTADQIAAQFARQYPNGGWLTVKQTAWLFGVYKDEVRAAMRQNATLRGAIGYEAAGSFTNEAGQVVDWTLYQAPNMAGNFNHKLQKTAAEYQAERDAEIASMRAFIETMQAVNAPIEMYQHALDRIKVLGG
jgi:hypothetical protein